MAELSLAGYSDDEISDLISRETGLQITRRQVGYDLARLHDQWLAGAAEDHAKEMVIELRRLDRLERELWQAWRRSQEDAETLTEEEFHVDPDRKTKKKNKLKDQIDDEWLDNPPAGTPVKSKLVRQGQSGNPAFTAQIHAVQQERRRLKNLYAAQRSELEITHKVKSYNIVSPADFDDPDAHLRLPAVAPTSLEFDIAEGDFEEVLVNG